ncbi:phosphonate C-P lyase system protein PhnG [Candidatus Gracilibacteria bacterium]|nr:phosphonate C-P lyase system protein PhnG [Candidatus Gracilibacteria bacterium]
MSEIKIEHLSVLARVPPAEIKAFVEELIPALEPIEVLVNRTGLAMLPMEEQVKGTTFYLGEVLLAEAHVRAAGSEGYAACLGRDLEQALAIALLDAAQRGQVETDAIIDFVHLHAANQQAEDEALLRAVAATRVELETFGTVVRELGDL